MADNPTNPDAALETEAPAVSEPGVPATTEPYPATDYVNPAATGTISPTDQAAQTRMQQQIARQKKLIATMGLDPDSDVADRVEAGLLTKEDIVNAIAPAPATAPQVQPNPQLEAKTKANIRDIIAKAKKDGATNDDFVQAMEAFDTELSTLKQVAQQDAVNKAVDDCVQVVNSRLQNDPGHQAMPDELKRVEEQMFLSSTDNLVMEEARTRENPDAYLNSGVYDFYANKNAERLGQLRDYWINQGRQTGTGGVPAETINPIAPSSGGAAPGAPGVKVTAGNWKQIAKAWKPRGSTQ